MIDQHTQKQFVKAIGISVNNDGIVFSHDYGEKILSWNSISHVFGAVIERKNKFPSPLFILMPEDEQAFYYVDGNSFIPKYFILDRTSSDTVLDPKSQPYSQIRKTKEDEFKKFIKEICSHCSRAVIDNALIGYLRGSNIFLPAFSNLKDIARYCLRVKDSISKMKGERFPGLDEIEEDELKAISMLTKKREELKEGTLLEGRFVIEEVMKGGMGIVYIVFDPQNIRFLAAKTFQEKYLWDEKVVKQFIKEAEIWVKLDHHPNIVKAELVKVIEGKPYIFLEYVPGTDLDRLLRRWFIPVKTAIEYAIQFCTGMNYAYNKLNLIHRDIKPSNCLITKDGIFKITDFGLGKIFDESTEEGELVSISKLSGRGKKTRTVSSSTMMMGTIPFMAPELFSNIKSASIKTDIYSFGVLLYMMLTGRNPFFNDDIAQVIENHQSLISENPKILNKDVPEALARLTLKCLEKNPKDRYRDFAEIKIEMELIYKEVYSEEYIQPPKEDVFSEEDWLNKGLSLASLSRHGEAIITFEQALRLNPQSLRARIYRGYSLLNMGRSLEALICLDEGMKMNPQNWELWFYKGESHWKLGEKFVALACFDRALTLTDEQSRILGQKGKLLEEMGKIEEAIACFDAALSKDPRAAEIWNEKGKILIQLKNFDGAIECLNQSLDINPRFKWGWYYQGLALSRLGYFNESIRAYKRAIMLDQEFVEAWINIGDCYRSIGKYEEAIKAYSTTIDLQPKKLDTYLSIVKLLKEESRWEEALELVEKALTIEPHNMDLLVEKVELTTKLGYYEESAVLCQVVMEKYPDNEEVKLLFSAITKWKNEKRKLFGLIFSSPVVQQESSWNDLNSLLCNFCDLSDAINHLEISRDESAQDCYLKAALYFIVGEYNRAFQNIRNSIESLPDKSKAQRLKELIELRQESLLKKSVSIFKKGETHDKSAEEFFILGMEKLRRKQFSEARNLLRDALNLDSSMHACRFFIGKSYEMEHKMDKALYYYDTFTKYIALPMGFWKKKLSCYHQEEPKEIESIYHKLIASFPDNHTYWIAYCLYLSENKQYEKLKLLALGLLEKYLETLDIPKESAFFWNIQGLLQLFLKRYEFAKQSFLRALKIEPENVTAHLGMVKYLEATRMYTDAENYCRKLRRKTHTYGIASYFLSGIFMKQSLINKSINIINEALEKLSDSPLLMIRKAYILLKSHKYAEFNNYCAEIYSTTGNYIPYKTIRILSLMESQRIDDSIFESYNILLLNYHNVAVLKNLGFLYLQSQNYTKALSTFDSILQIYPVDFELFLGKGMAYYFMKDYKSAFESLQKAIELHPLDPDLWQCMSALYYQMENYSDSLKCWDRALQKSNKITQALANKGIFLYFQGRFREALECLEKFLRLDPEHFRVSLIKAQCQAKLGSLDDAIRTTEKVLSFSPQYFHAWILRGNLEFSRKNYEMSFQSYEKAIQIESRNGELWYNRALVLLYLENRPEAKKALERSLALTPNLFEIHILYSVYESIMRNDSQSNIYLTRAKMLNREKFEAWMAIYQETNDPLSTLTPIEINEEQFELPIIQPLSRIEQVEILDYLYYRNIR